MYKNDTIIKFNIKQNKKYDYKIDFVFSPTRSHLHSFNENPPKDWNEVYKVYYSWQIVEVFEGEPEVLFNMEVDECSCLTDLAYYIRDILYYNAKHHTIRSLGQPGSEWIIKADGSIIHFEIWQDPSNQGYRFWLTRDRAEEFAKFLDQINKYMLEHGEPI